MLAVTVLSDYFNGLVDRLHGSRSHGSSHGSNHKSSHHCQRFYYTEHRLFEQSLDVYYPAGGKIGTATSTADAAATAPAPAPAAAVVCLVVGSAWLGHSRLIYGPTSWWNSSGPRSVAHVNVGVGGGVVCVCIRHRGSFPKVGEYFLKWNWIWNWIWICMAVLAAVVLLENENENENECRHYDWNPYNCHSRFHDLQRIVAISASIVAAFISSLLLLEKIVTRGGNNQSATFEEMQHDVMSALAWCHRHRDQIILLDNADNNSSSSTRTRSPPFLFGGYSSGGHVAATLLQRPASFWTETHRLPPPEQFFVAALYISPVLATRSIHDFCRDEGVWDLLWKEEKKGENQYENGHGRGELPRENMKWHRKHSSSSTMESSASNSADSVASSSSSLTFSSRAAIPLSTETSHYTATTTTTSSSSFPSSPSSSSSSSSSLEEQQQHCTEEQSSHDKRMESSQQKNKQCTQQQLLLQKHLQMQLSPPTWLTDQILQLVFGTTQTDGNHINNNENNNNHRHNNHHRPPHHPPSPLHDYRKTPFLPHIFIGCQREVPFGISWLDSFFVSRIYSILLREKLFPERDTPTKMVVHENEQNDGATGHREHRSVVDSRYCEIQSSDHWNILQSRELFRVLEREIGRVVRESARGDSGGKERTGRSNQ